MIYKTFDTIPYKLLIEIMQDNDVHKLATENEEMPIEELQDIWEAIHTAYLESNPSFNDKGTVNLYGEIYHYELKYKYIKLACKILSFDFDEECFNTLISFGYYMTMDNYMEQLERIDREAEGVLTKVDTLKMNLPAQSESGENVTVDDMLASYAVFLAIDFDFNTVTASKVMALGKQIDKKIKSTLNTANNGK